jgi:cytoskeleton protein RodZ
VSDTDSMPQSPAQASAGAALLAERRRQSLSLGDVSRQLKLAVRQVEAIERDDYSGFRPVFVHGFIRNYAKLLGLDPEPLIRAADSMLKPAPPVATDPVEAQSTLVIDEPQRKPALLSTRGWTVVAVVIFVGVVLALSFGAKRSRDALPGVSAVASRDKSAPDPKAVAKSPAAKPAEAKPAETDSVDVRTANAQVADASSAAKARPPESAPASRPESSPTAEADDANKIRVRMVFDREAWVEIKDRNGVTIFGQLNAAGTRRSASGEPPLSVVVGNASGVHLFLGEKSIDLVPHTRADIDLARLKLE